MARPRKNPQQRHRNRVDLRFTDEEYAQAERVASRWGIPLATVVRTAFLIGWAEYERRLAAASMANP